MALDEGMCRGCYRSSRRGHDMSEYSGRDQVPLCRAEGDSHGDTRLRTLIRLNIFGTNVLTGSQCPWITGLTGIWISRVPTFDSSEQHSKI